MTRASHQLLLLSVFVIATCGLIYELIAGTLASYLLGDSVTQFSTVIGTYLFAMGIGSWLSRFFQRGLVRLFVQTQLLLAVVGGFSAAGLFLLFTEVASFRILLYATVLIIGTLVGLEIPVLLRILQGRVEFKDLVSQVFTFDYIGALLASLLFPLLLVPRLGLVRSAMLFGMLNAAVALLTTWVLREELPRPAWLRNTAFLILAVLGAGMIAGESILTLSEARTFPDPVIYAQSTPYQRIVLTRAPNDLRLYLNGNLQFSSRDEYRYHEALVHPLLSRLPGARRVLILGGGDGLAVREVLRYPQVEHVQLVDLDPAMTHLFSSHPQLTALNHECFDSPKLHVANADAFTWLERNPGVFDAVIIDFPDPTNFSLGKLYTTTFFQRLTRVLAPDAAVAIQTTSPYVARRSFWCVNATLQSCGFATQPYHCYVPSFGEWGFILAGRTLPAEEAVLPADLRFLSAQTLPQLYSFPTDMAAVPTEINRLNNQALVHYFEEEWQQYVH